MAVNGGATYTVTYAKNGLIPAQRSVTAGWQQYVRLPDIVMMPYSTTSASVDPTLPGLHVAAGATVSDSAGTRQAALIFSSGTTATATLPGGGSLALTPPFVVRSTEFTVGANGPDAMPAALPPNSAYTYAAEFSIQEAVTAGATDVTLSSPVVFYQKNFIGFPVGTQIPLGYYDRGIGHWVPANNGRVIKIVSITAGKADLDTDGNGSGDNGTGGLVISDDERAALLVSALNYTVNDILWRCEIPHFSPWDMNWAFEPPVGAIASNAAPPTGPEPIDSPDNSCGSVIDCQNQALGESIPLVGTPFRLHYRSDRVRGRAADRHLHVPLRSGALPTEATHVEIEIEIAGRRFQQVFTAAEAPEFTTFTWDGGDAYGRALQGPQQARVRVGYRYNATYTQTGRFGYSGNGTRITGTSRVPVVTLWRDYDVALGNLDHLASRQGLGGWSLSAQHVYTPYGREVYYGSGERRSADALGQMNRRVAGDGTFGDGGDGGSALAASFGYITRLAVAPDGGVFVADHWFSRVRRIHPTDGKIYAVPGTAGNLAAPEGIAIGPDGLLYVADTNRHRVVAIDTVSGSLTVVAGITNVAGSSGDGGIATAAKLQGPTGVAFGPDGTLYIADKFNGKVRAVSPPVLPSADSIIRTVAGGGSNLVADGALATTVSLFNPSDVALDARGNLYVAVSAGTFVCRVDTGGRIYKVAGTGDPVPFNGDGIAATAANLNVPNALAVTPDGAIYIAELSGHRIRRVDPDGTIRTVAGTGQTGYTGEDGNPLLAKLYNPSGVALAPDGSVYIADQENRRVRQVAPPLPGLGQTEVLVPSADAAEVYVFDGSGRHQRTHDGLTGALRYEFHYSDGLLTDIEDGDGNVTTIERDGSGELQAIVGPYGQRTEFTLDDEGYIATATNPNDEETSFTYSDDGLMETMTDAREHTWTFTYDVLGRLQHDSDPAGGSKALSRTSTTDSFSVALTTEMARITSYGVETLANGTERRTTTAPDGAVSQRDRLASRAVETIDADGTERTLKAAPDDRFGLQAPELTEIVTTPDNLQQTRQTVRTATLVAGNPLNMSSQQEVTTINATRVFQRNFANGTPNDTLTEISAEDRHTVSTFNAEGRVIKVQRTGLHPIRFDYDDDGRIETIKHGPDPDTSATRVTTMTYKGGTGTDAGYLDTVTETISATESRGVQYGYDGAGRVIAQTFLSPDNRTIAFNYDATSNLSSVTPPGQPEHTFDFTAVNLLDTYLPPEVDPSPTPRVTTYDYNVDRQLTEVMQPDSKQVDYNFTATTGNLETLTLQPSGEERTYDYDEDTGQLNRISTDNTDDPDLTFTHDGFLLTGEAWSSIGSVTHIYDDNFQQIGLQVNAATPITFSYDEDGLMTSAGSLTLTRSGTNGLLQGTTLGNTSDTWTHNQFGEPQRYTASYNSTSIFDVEYLERDHLGRITRKRESIDGGTAVDTYYRYDAAGRLWRVCATSSCSASDPEYTYDANGNRLSAPNLTGTPIYDDQDRLIEYGSTTYTYTANGDLASKTDAEGTTTYVYDALGNLRLVMLPVGTEIEYLIDGRNRRVGKKVDGDLTQQWLYQDQLNPVAELDGSGTLVAQFIYGTKSDVPDFMIKGAVSYRIVSDHLGSVRLVVDTETGDVVQQIDYDEFGNATLMHGTWDVQPFGFGGGLFDHQLALVRFGDRDYDAQIGRWTAKDPIRFQGDTPNLYEYVNGDPVQNTDPSGQESSPGMGSQPGLGNTPGPQQSPSPCATTTPSPTTQDCLTFYVEELIICTTRRGSCQLVCNALPGGVKIGCQIICGVANYKCENRASARLASCLTGVGGLR